MELKDLLGKRVAIYCKTQEEWDFVLTKDNPFKRLKVREEQWKTWGKNSVIFINHNKWTKTDLDWAKSNNAKIYSFQEWCNKFGHKPDFMNKEKEWIPKIDEWVVATESPNNYCNTELIIGQIASFDSFDKYWLKNVQNVAHNWIGTKKFCCDRYPLRKALSNEIPQEINNSIPEYVECIQEIKNCYGTLGKIYKVANWNYNESDCMLVGTTSYSTSKKRFKPSTKEAYEAQQSNNSNIKEGDWVVLLDDYGELNKGEVYKCLEWQTGSKLCMILEHSNNPCLAPFVKNLRKALPHEIPNNSLSEEEKLLEEAKRRYPIGCKIKSALKGDNNPATVFVENYFINRINGRIVIWAGKVGFIYDDGNWAKIVEDSSSKSIVDLIKPYQEEYDKVMTKTGNIIYTQGDSSISFNKPYKNYKKPERIPVKVRNNTNIAPKQERVALKIFKTQLLTIKNK